MWAYLSCFQINSFKQHRKISASHHDLARGARRDPSKGSFLEPFVVKPQAVAIPLEQFDPVATLVQKDENRSGEYVFIELVTDDGEQAVMGLAEVDRCAAEKDLCRT